MIKDHGIMKEMALHRSNMFLLVNSKASFVKNLNFRVNIFFCIWLKNERKMKQRKNNEIVNSCWLIFISWIMTESVETTFL